MKCKKKCIIFPEIILAPPPPFEKKKIMQNSYHFQMHLAYILLMALYLWKFSAADLHWCSHSCSYYKIQGNKNVINKLIQTLKAQLYWNIYFRINNCTSLQKILPYAISVKEIFYWDSKRLKSNFVETALFLRCRLDLNSQYSFMILKKKINAGSKYIFSQTTRPATSLF